MLTLLLYVLIMAIIATVLFLLAAVVFGRGEELPPLPAGTTVTALPHAEISGTDVRALRFQQVVRGYKASEVDWALARLGTEIDALRAQLLDAGLPAWGAAGPPPATEPAPVPVSLVKRRVKTEPEAPDSSG